MYTNRMGWIPKPLRDYHSIIMAVVDPFRHEIFWQVPEDEREVKFAHLRTQAYIECFFGDGTNYLLLLCIISMRQLIVKNVPYCEQLTFSSD